MTLVSDRSQSADAAVSRVREILDKHVIRTVPPVAVILGSGLRHAADDVLDRGGIAIHYTDLPGMPVPHVPGHEGRLIVGTGDTPCVLLQGRSHYYEGWSPADITFCVSLLSGLGVQTLIVTNAAGGISPGYQPGHLMLIDGHLSFVDLSVLGSTNDGSAIRSLRVWDEELLRTAALVPSSLMIHQGTYAMMSGPNYETPAEIGMLRHLGADAVGMSTVPEALAAHQHGMRVVGISCITNAAAGLGGTPLSHDEVGEAAAAVEQEFAAWLLRLIDAIAHR